MNSGKYICTVLFFKNPVLKSDNNINLSQEGLGAWWNIMNPSICKVKHQSLKYKSVHTIKRNQVSLISNSLTIPVLVHHNITHHMNLFSMLITSHKMFVLKSSIGNSAAQIC